MNGPGHSLTCGLVELGEVTSVEDPDSLNRVKVRFLSRGPATDHATNADRTDATAWAMVAVPFAGNGNGAFLLPDVGSRVVLSFVNGDTRYPIVLGTIWSGSDASPEKLGGDGKTVDRWSFTGKAGTRIAMVEENGQSKIEIATPAGNSITINDSDSALKVVQGGNSMTMDSGGIKLSSQTVEIEAASFKLSAASASFQTPIADFSAFVMCEMVQSNTVVSTTYTPGAGNML